MIGYALKKLAKEHQMNVDHGRAYGNFRGYAVTFYEGSGWKEINISCLILDEEQEQQLRDTMASLDLRKAYRVVQWSITENAIYIRFHDNPGTMKKVYAFIDWFFPLLDYYGATGADVCTQCGTQITNGNWYIIGDTAFHMHESCGNRLRRLENHKEALDKEENQTSYLTGLIGAFIGAMIGAVVWGIVYYMGYVAAVVGIVIGILASKGYDIAQGRQTKKKNIILLIVTFIAVVVGTFGAYCYELMNLISSGNLPDYSMGDIPWMIGVMLKDGEFLKTILSDIGLGMLFALLGLSFILRQVHIKNRDKRPKLLDK